MTYAEAITLRATLETALSTGVLSISHNGRSLTYESKEAMTIQLGKLNRDIAESERKTAGQTQPGSKTPTWNY